MNYFLEGLEYKWTLRRETLCEQVFTVVIDSKEYLTAKVDIFYIRPKEVGVRVFIMGNRRVPIDELWLWLSLDLEQIIENYCCWDVIEYFLTDASNGNDAIKYHGFLIRIIEPRFDSQSP
jgi:hypothetical protein